MRFEDAYHLKSNDYYSSRNYASRLIGTRLIVYSPLYVPYNAEVSTEWMPAVRRWTGNPQAGFQRIVSAHDIYIPRQWENPERASIDAIHTVTECDLAAPELRCRATSVLGPAGRTFYVSAHAVYVWVTDYGWWRPERERNQSMLYRLPLDGSAPSAVVVHGAPVDQFSFREDWEEGVLNVLVRSDGGGDAMWNPEFSSGDVALLRVARLRDFGDGTDVLDPRPLSRTAAPGRQRLRIPKPLRRRLPALRHRQQLGRARQHERRRRRGQRRAAAASRNYRLSHGVDRIEAMGDDAVVIGADQRNLTFQAIELTQGWRPQLGDRYQLESAAQGETRSHAFFFKPEANDNGEGTPGVLGLPVTRASRPGYRQLVEGSAAITFLSRENRRFLPLGELFSGDLRSANDNCRASCVDWYGNARPIFLRGRTFALMGYELVEGEVGPRQIREIRRTNFRPRCARLDLKQEEVSPPRTPSDTKFHQEAVGRLGAKRRSYVWLRAVARGEGERLGETWRSLVPLVVIFFPSRTRKRRPIRSLATFPHTLPQARKPRHPAIPGALCRYLAPPADQGDHRIKRFEF